MEHAHCDDAEVKRVKSPNGKLVAAIYNRNCSGGSSLMTYADVEDPSQWFIWPRVRHPEVCFLATLHDGYHQMDVAWKDDQHINVSSTDELDNRSTVSLPEVPCKDIEVAYDFKFAPPPLDEAPDKETAEAIAKAILQMEPCFNYASHPERRQRLESLMKDGQHGDALEWLCTYMIDEHCPIPPDALRLIQEAATKMRRTKMSCYRIEQRVAR
jgi:hypothetical protein